MKKCARGDGCRILAYEEGIRVTLFSGAAHDRTRTFPEIAAAVAGLEPQSLVLDGEIVTGMVYAVFDCFYMDGYDLRWAPLAARRACLKSAVNGTRGSLGRDGGQTSHGKAQYLIAVC